MLIYMSQRVHDVVRSRYTFIQWSASPHNNRELSCLILAFYAQSVSYRGGVITCSSLRTSKSRSLLYTLRCTSRSKSEFIWNSLRAIEFYQRAGLLMAYGLWLTLTINLTSLLIYRRILEIAILKLCTKCASPHLLYILSFYLWLLFSDYVNVTHISVRYTILCRSF